MVAYIPQDEVDEEVTEKLDAIVRIAQVEKANTVNGAG